MSFPNNNIVIYFAAVLLSAAATFRIRLKLQQNSEAELRMQHKNELIKSAIHNFLIALRSRVSGAANKIVLEAP